MPSSSSSVSYEQSLLKPFKQKSRLISLPVVNILLHIYAVHAWPTEEDAVDPEEAEAQSRGKYTNANGGYMNGRTRSTSEAQRIQDAETFELQGLISDEEDEAGSSSAAKKRNDQSNKEER